MASPSWRAATDTRPRPCAGSSATRSPTSRSAASSPTPTRRTSRPTGSWRRPVSPAPIRPRRPSGSPWNGHDGAVEPIDEMDAGPPDGFVAAREAAAQAAREAGDAAAAKAIAGLRKPTVAAWLVNRLALKRPDLVTGLAELSGSLRTAQRELRGEKL